MATIVFGYADEGAWDVSLKDYDWLFRHGDIIGYPLLVSDGPYTEMSDRVCLTIARGVSQDVATELQRLKQELKLNAPHPTYWIVEDEN